jgi:glucose/mannose transport system substrate-binding protein
MTREGNIYAVLVGIHRGNVLWYNKKLLDKNGIRVGEKMTFDEFFAACDKLKTAGIPALGVGDSGIWASALLFENTLLGVVGAEGWTDLFSGKMQWSDPELKKTMKLKLRRCSRAQEFEPATIPQLPGGCRRQRSTERLFARRV